MARPARLRTIAGVAAGLLLLAVAGCAVLQVPDLPRADLEARWGAPPSAFLEVAGARLHVRDEGPRDAPVLLLLHGFAASLHTWDALVAAMPDRRLVRVDLPGFGLTGPTGDDGELATARRLAALLDRLGIAEAVVVGSSLGGRQAVALAAHAPARIRGLVLLAPPSAGIAGGGGWLAPALRRLDPGPLLWLGLGSAYADPALATPEVRARYRDLLLAPGVRDAILERGRRGTPAPSAPDAPPPTLLVWGSEDRIVPPSVSAAWGRLLPDARLVVLPGVGHLPMEEAPGVLADLLRAEAAPR
jgi:pimeloyl-ACP methyl ester carboxylesterase